MINTGITLIGKVDSPDLNAAKLLITGNYECFEHIVSSLPSHNVGLFQGNCSITYYINSTHDRSTHNCDGNPITTQTPNLH